MLAHWYLYYCTTLRLLTECMASFYRGWVLYSASFKYMLSFWLEIWHCRDYQCCIKIANIHESESNWVYPFCWVGWARAWDESTSGSLPFPVSNLLSLVHQCQRRPENGSQWWVSGLLEGDKTGSSERKVMASEGRSNMSEEQKRAHQLDIILGFGNYQWFQVWLFANSQ